MTGGIPMKYIATFLSGALAGAILLYVCSSHATVMSPALPCAATAAAAPVLVMETATVSVSETEVPVANLLLVPVAGIKVNALRDTFNDARDAERRHEAMDILAPIGTPVFAVADGKIVKLFNSKPGGLTVYQFDTSEKFAYYYAHLDRYAADVKEGMTLKRGDLVGYVGTSGNADPNTPHLHFAVFALGPLKQWWKGSPINPYPLMGGTARP